MTTIQTNLISGLGTNGIQIACPVGISANNSTNGLVVSGTVVVENSGAEVVTVVGENFGVKVRGLTGPPTIIRGFASIPNPFEASIFFSNNLPGATSGRRADITSTINKDIRFNTTYITGYDKTLGLTGPRFTNAGGTDGGFYRTDTNSKFSSNVVFKDSVGFGTNPSLNSLATFASQYVPKCAGIAEFNDQLINLELFKKAMFNLSNLKTWSVFGTLNNGGVGTGTGRSGNFFRRLFGKAKQEPCCGGVPRPGSFNQQAYTETLQGRWICIGFSTGLRSCSCNDNEQFHYPIDNSAVWEINDNSVRNTIPSNLQGNYNLFGFLVQPYF